MPCKTDDAGGLTPGKEENEARHKKDRKNTSFFNWFVYNLSAQPHTPTTVEALLVDFQKPSQKFYKTPFTKPVGFVKMVYSLYY